ncbi:helix-turn-helix domain-containing protein [Rufibacter glacialis]|uniref:Helix-turn-helix domain-containing protein n=1 Tax=Rufibacter glacialis TaxID=1259555 RepID=A0A5M8QHH8_9BACT|nr:helix-turn-helix domain-containing protein [Rufibacter glacialis]KAA6434236.1 helix-turn-helix domain-containing protein [Rufibacter glacialis]GGK67997.1 transcriptional regulator [Rufibacter glacialis]
MISVPDMFQLQALTARFFHHPKSSELYQILLLEGNGTISVDFTEYEFEGKIALFTTPYQHLSISSPVDLPVARLAFHGDFYCIEYHKQEVACNGLLFNNIYKKPFIHLKDKELDQVFEKLRFEVEKDEPYSEPVLRTYLQLVLAISSKIKRQEQQLEPSSIESGLEKFQELLEAHFLTQRSPLFYSDQLAISPTVFTKKCKLLFGKPPSLLIQERVMLEAKKQLHLTRKSIKEVAGFLQFEDEHYFSRFFKKHTGISPTVFREKVGISIVADLSMR